MHVWIDPVKLFLFSEYPKSFTRRAAHSQPLTFERNFCLFLVRQTELMNALHPTASRKTRHRKWRKQIVAVASTLDELAKTFSNGTERKWSQKYDEKHGKIGFFSKVLHPTFTADITKQKSNGCTKHVQRHVINSDLDGTCLSDSQRKKMSKWNFIWLRIQSTCCMLVTTGESLISWHHRGINYQLPESAGGSASIQEIKVHEWFHYRHFDEDCH